MLALRIDAVIDPADFDRRIDDLISTTKAVPLAHGMTEVFYPGEIENHAEVTGRATEVLLPDKTITELQALGDSVGHHPRPHRPADRGGVLMYTVIVNLRVQPGWLDEFVTGIHANALASLLDEPGCLRFDVHEQVDDPHAFVLYEIYISRTAFEVDHRRASHYAAWREVTAACVVPGSHVNTFCTPVFPQDIPENADASTGLVGSGQPE